MKNENLRNLIVLFLAACIIAAVGFTLVGAAVDFDWPEPTMTPEPRPEPAAPPPTYREPYSSALPESFGKREPVYR